MAPLDDVRVLELTHAEGESAKHAHEAIARQVGHISHLVNDLLDVERVVSGKIRLNREPLDMAEAVRRAVATFTGDARLNRQVDISTEPVWVISEAPARAMPSRWRQSPRRRITSGSACATRRRRPSCCATVRWPGTRRTSG